MARILRFAIMLAIISTLAGLGAAFAYPISPELAEPLRIANASQKILLVDFYSDSCELCTKMDGNLDDTDVKSIIDNNFYYYKVDISDPAYVDCAKYYQITGTPTMLAFNGDGSALLPCIGYKDPKPFIEFLNKAIAAYIPPEKINADLADSLKSANSAGKQLLVYFFGDWSEDCDRMDRVLEDPKLKEAMEKHYSLCRVDVGHMDEHKSCVTQYKLNTLPTIIAFNPDGTTKTRLEKVLTPAQMIAFLKNAEVFVPLASGVTAELTDAFKAASDAGKQLLVNFFDSTSEDSLKMDETLADSGVQSEIGKHYSYFKLDITQRAKFKYCLAQYKITDTPTVLAFNSDGSLSGRVDGYQDVDGFKSFLSMSETSVAAPEGIHPDLADALKAAKDAGKTLIVDFKGDWLQTSTDMDQTLSSSDVQSALDKKFYLFKLDIGHFDNHKSCTDRYKVRSIPYLIAFNEDGSVRTESRGYLSPAQMNVFLSKVESGSKGFTSYDLEDISGSGDAVKNAISKASGEGKLLAVYFYNGAADAVDPTERSIEQVDAMTVASNFAILRVDFTAHKTLAAHYGWKKAPLIVLFKKGGKFGVSLQSPVASEKLAAEMQKLVK
jgi:thioredoxin-related protein